MKNLLNKIIQIIQDKINLLEIIKNNLDYNIQELIQSIQYYIEFIISFYSEELYEILRYLLLLLIFITILLLKYFIIKYNIYNIILELVYNIKYIIDYLILLINDNILVNGSSNLLLFGPLIKLDRNFEYLYSRVIPNRFSSITNRWLNWEDYIEGSNPIGFACTKWKVSYYDYQETRILDILLNIYRSDHDKCSYILRNYYKYLYNLFLDINSDEEFMLLNSKILNCLSYKGLRLDAESLTKFSNAQTYWYERYWAIYIWWKRGCYNTNLEHQTELLDTLKSIGLIETIHNLEETSIYDTQKSFLDLTLEDELLELNISLLLFFNKSNKIFI
jgi:hypothetical protein